MESSPIKELAESLLGMDLEDGEFITDVLMVVRTQSFERDAERVEVVADVDPVAHTTVVGMLERAKFQEMWPDGDEYEDDDDV